MVPVSYTITVQHIMGLLFLCIHVKVTFTVVGGCGGPNLHIILNCLAV